jgi:FAD/FMN-containing dehydrogenase/Fe-S oxidoreductase
MSTAHARPGDSALAARLRREVRGDVLFDAASRGRYATDASIYQIEPVGVVVPVDHDDVRAAFAVARAEGVPILARGGGTSQCGQTVGAALVLDHSKFLRTISDFDPDRRTVSVEPGVVLDELNAWLKPHGLWYPVDVSTSAQATLGGMAGNNSAGSRSIRYGIMVENVLGIDALLADGSEYTFGDWSTAGSAPSGPPGYVELVQQVLALSQARAADIEERVPKLSRRVGGYNVDRLLGSRVNTAHLLVGSEGTLAWSRRLHLALSELPRHKALGVCHFPSLHRAMESTRHIVELGPVAVELVDRTMIELARENAAFAASVRKCIVGEPGAILLVEFAGEQQAPQLSKLAELDVLCADLGLPGSVVAVTDARLMRDVWEVRKAGLNIMMSMKGDGKPVSFIEDCAVPLEHLAEYTARLSEVFAKHGTQGTWYAHASVGCLHVRPVLDMRRDGAQKMRAIAEEAAELVQRFKGVYSGEHGDGIARSEWIEPFFGAALTRTFEAIKALFDPKNLLNPGKIVRAPKQDDRSLFRYPPGYRSLPIVTALDWSESGGLDKAVEMCNNNGACRKFDAGTMCPSYRVTRDEEHTTRGRANTLRLALSGQLGPEALTSEAMHAAFELCVACKGCKRECPTGVDMAKMKVEFLHHYRRRHGLPLKDRLVAYLPLYAPLAAQIAPVANALTRATRGLLGFSTKRELPRFRRAPFAESAPRVRARASDASGVRERASDDAGPVGRAAGERPTVVLFVDTFNRYFEPENAEAAVHVLERAGYRVQYPERGGRRPLCCGRTLLESGLVDAARNEARRTLEALAPLAARGLPIVGLEPSCLLTLRDEFLSLGLGERAKALAAQAVSFEEFIVRERASGRFSLECRALPQKRALLHGHCHQKAFGLVPDVTRALALVPELTVETIDSSCCGMAGSFGYDAKHEVVSEQMAELALWPRVRAADEATLIIADGTSCRQQIALGTNRHALHVSRVLESALP